MEPFSHHQQLKAWEREHQQPSLLPKISSDEVSGGLVKFFNWLQARLPTKQLRVIEMCCGKGRNVLWLAQLGVDTIGTDFSVTAIQEAKLRARSLGVTNRTKFLVHDATRPYPFAANSFDVAIDCFGSTDIETNARRRRAIDNVVKLLKPGGYLFSYLVAATGEYFEAVSAAQPLEEKGSYIHQPSGKFEKNFDAVDVQDNYRSLRLLEMEFLDKPLEIGNQSYPGQLIWSVFQKS